ncbi:hypothetical protein Hanom_Chr04g00301651 [Helianthus anomalus]
MPTPHLSILSLNFPSDTNHYTSLPPSLLSEALTLLCYFYFSHLGFPSVQCNVVLHNICFI